MKMYTTEWSIWENGKTHVENSDIFDIEEILVYNYNRTVSSQEIEILYHMKKGQKLEINFPNTYDKLTITALIDIDFPY